jgi:Spy/CpxP family protein refolding chaperone
VKTPPFLLIGCPVIIVIACVIYALTYPALHQTAFHAALVDAESPALVDTTAANGSSEAAADANYRRHQMQRAFSELGLTDEQKKQIAQIRKTLTDRTERRAAIMNVLTPEQRAKWQQIRNSRNGGTDAPATPSPAATTNAVSK